MEEKSLSKKGNTEVVVSTDFLKFVNETTFTGNEDVSSKSLSIPFLKIAQALTKALNKNGTNYIQGLEIGHFYNTLNSKSYGNKIRVVALDYFETYTEWKKKKESFIKAWSKLDFEKAKNKLKYDEEKFCYVTPEGTELHDTRNYFVVLPDHIEDGIILFSFMGSGISRSMKWNSLNQITKPPKESGVTSTRRYFSVWELETSEFKNNNGTWYQITNPKFINWVWNEKGLDQAVLAAVKDVIDLKGKVDQINYNEEDSHDNSESNNTNNEDF